MFSSYIMPGFIALIIFFGLAKGTGVFEKFTEGAYEGLKIIVKMAPVLVGLLTAVSMFRASGAADLLTYALKPVLSLLNIPAELMPIAVLRPVSGSGSFSLLSEVLQRFGPDSMIGRAACVVLSSTETTFYTIAIYFGSCGIKHSGYTLPAALAADLTALIAGVFFVNLFFS